HAIHVATAESGISKREVRIDLDRSTEVFDCGVDIFTRDRVVNERRETISTTQVFFSRSRVGSRFPRELILFGGTQFKPQPLDDPLHNRVLNSNDVARIRVDSLTPENLARTHVEYLRGHSQPVARAKERRSE